MPEFILNTEGAGAPWHSLDTFTKGFIEAAFFSENSHMDADEFFSPEGQHKVTEGQSDGNIPDDSSVADIDSDSFVLIKNFCDEFQARAADLLKLAYERGYDESQAGRDLYFTRAGHGVGYWDRDVLESDGLGNKLSEAAGRGEINLTAYEDERATLSNYFIEFYIG